MKKLCGIVVHLATGMGRTSGTDDPIYVGVSGSAGGREFPLDVRGRDDFERGDRATYALGEVWEDEAVVGALEPREAKTSWNDPGLSFVGFDEIDRVWLRKHCHARSLTDDAWELDEVTVLLYGPEGSRRVFRTDVALRLGAAYGAQVWLPEIDGAGFTVSLRT